MDYKTFLKLLESKQNDKIKLLYGDYVVKHNRDVALYFEQAIALKNFEIASWLLSKGILITDLSTKFLEKYHSENYLNFQRQQKLSQSCFQ